MKKSDPPGVRIVRQKTYTRTGMPKRKIEYDDSIEFIGSSPRL